MDLTPNGDQTPTDPAAVDDIPRAGAAAPVAPAPVVAPVVEPPAATAAEWQAGAPLPSRLPPAPVSSRRSSSSGVLGTAALVLAGALAVGGIAFAAGRLTAPAAATTTGRFGNGQFGSGGALPSGAPGFVGRGGFGPSIEGTVESIDGSSITVKLQNGPTTTIMLDSSTTYSQQTSTTASAVTPGSTVLVRVALDGAGGPNTSPGAVPSLGPGTARSVTVVAEP